MQLDTLDIFFLLDTLETLLISETIKQHLLTHNSIEFACSSFLYIIMFIILIQRSIIYDWPF